MAKSTDRRVRKTEAQLIQGLTKLMKEKSIKQITVRELADEVDINRSTFYLHYNDIYDMVEKIENRLVDKFITGLEELSKNHINQNALLQFMEDSYTILYSNADICSALLSENGDIMFMKKLHRIIYKNAYDIIKNLMPNNSPTFEVEFATSFCVSGIVGIVEHWLHDINADTPKNVARLSFNLIERGISSISK